MFDERHIQFRKLRLNDLSLLHQWLNQQFVKEWYSTHELTDAAAIERKYLPCIESKRPTQCYIFYYQDTPVGYIQSYKIGDYPEYAQFFDMDTNGLVGVDMFIGNQEYFGQGLGSLVLKKFLHDIVSKMDGITSCVIGPDPKNARAIRSYEKAGFTYLRTIYNAVDHEFEYIVIQKVK